MKLQGIFAEITTPFDHKGDIYKTKVEHNVEKWNRTTLAGYVVCGRAGEGELLLPPGTKLRVESIKDDTERDPGAPPAKEWKKVLLKQVLK